MGRHTGDIAVSIKQIAVLLLAAMVVTGCGKKTDKMGRVRPPVDELSDGGRGLQGKDVISASDQMAQDLLASSEINRSSTQLLIVVDRVENKTSTQRFNMDIFLMRLKVNLAKYGKGRVQLIENRDKLRELQSRELETGGGDQFGQGGLGLQPGHAGIQPDYALYARISELPNQDTSYFFLEFNLTNLKTRQLAWSNAYEVATNR
ncbi:MAG: hypothetical protein H7144_08040 [Burkholderiales bacterium]|nr:hypothetical protein [Phycisphaerae bacterium]